MGMKTVATRLIISRLMNKFREGMDKRRPRRVGIRRLINTEEDVSDLSSFLNDMQKHLAMLFMKTTEVHKLPRTVIMSIFSDFQIFLHLFVDFLQRHLRKLVEENVLRDTYNRLLTFLSSDMLDLLWTPIRSNHMFMKYVKQSLPYTEPQETRLSEAVTTPSHVLYYVPIRRVLVNMLFAGDAMEHILGACCESRDTKIICDILDGDFARERAILRSGDADTIILLLYTDELELVNPLGSAAGVHEILAAYFSVLNLHPKYRSRLNAIHFLMLVKYSHVKTYRFKRVLDTVIKETISIHESGLEISCGGQKKTLKVCLLGIVGDNLSLNRIGGFSSSFGSGHFCRFCVTDSKDINQVTTERNCLIRTAALHNSHLADIEVDRSKCKLYGVSMESPLLQVPGFDVTQQLLPDAMHDILEGGTAFVLKHVLKSLASS
ncbi:uncharacterized protein LOC135376891 [Ornithodoros turicata]|uniref:uncharacterized protein LOC135376891 n=1 Tax=Ornithodoros turicata TaxID=34597 RepID=UPI003138BE9D